MEPTVAHDPRIMHTTKPVLFIATETATFDLSPWIEEGYDTHLLTQATSRDIENAVDDLESSDKYAIIGRSPTPLSFPTNDEQLLVLLLLLRFNLRVTPLANFRPLLHTTQPPSPGCSSILMYASSSTSLPPRRSRHLLRGL